MDKIWIQTPLHFAPHLSGTYQYSQTQATYTWLICMCIVPKIRACICAIFYFIGKHPKKGNLMAVFVSFLTNFDWFIYIYSRILTFIIGVFSHPQKYSISRNILILSLFPKKGELIFNQASWASNTNSFLLILFSFLKINILNMFKDINFFCLLATGQICIINCWIISRRTSKSKV